MYSKTHYHKVSILNTFSKTYSENTLHTQILLVVLTDSIQVQLEINGSRIRNEKNSSKFSLYILMHLR